jgi:hypothetical protein
VAPAGGLPRAGAGAEAEGDGMTEETPWRESRGSRRARTTGGRSSRTRRSSGRRAARPGRSTTPGRRPTDLPRRSRRCSAVRATRCSMASNPSSPSPSSRCACPAVREGYFRQFSSGSAWPRARMRS